MKICLLPFAFVNPYSSMKVLSFHTFSSWGFIANFHAIYCLLTQFVNRMYRVPLIFIWRNMQYYFIQKILVSGWIIGAAHAQNGCFQCRSPAILWRRRLLINTQIFLTKLSAWVFTTVTVVGHYHITIHIIFNIAFVICIQWL
jgi:hypothetical protein